MQQDQSLQKEKPYGFWNWGTALVFVFIFGASGIIFMVYKSMQMSAEMVTENYYAEELKFQNVIDARSNANQLSSKVQVQQDQNGTILVAFPKEIAAHNPKGQIYFYNPSEEKRDYKTPLSIDANGLQVISGKNVSYGSYVVKIQWTMNNKEYYAELPFMAQK